MKDFAAAKRGGPCATSAPSIVEPAVSATWRNRPVGRIGMRPHDDHASQEPSTLKVPSGVVELPGGSPDQSFSHALRCTARQGSPYSPRVPGLSPDGPNGNGYRGTTALPHCDLRVPQLWFTYRDLIYEVVNVRKSQ